MNPYWMVDLEDNYYIDYITVTNRADCCDDRLHSIQVTLYSENPLHNPGTTPSFCAYFPGPVAAGVTQTIHCIDESAGGRYLKIAGLNRKSSSDCLLLCEVTVISLKNPVIASSSFSHQKTAYSSSNGFGSSPARAVDGNFNPQWLGASCWSSTDVDMDPYWMVDLDDNYFIDYITVTNRADCCDDRLHSIQVMLYPENPLQNSGTPSTLCAFYPGPVSAGFTQTISCIDGNASGRYVKINGLNRRNNNDVFHLCEVTVVNLPPVTASRSLALNKPTYSSINGFGSSPARAVDGYFKSNWRSRSCWESLTVDMNPYWMVDLEDNYYIDHITVTNRADCCDDRLHDIQVMLYAENPLLNPGTPSTLCAFYPGPVGAGITQTIVCIDGNASGRYLKINGLNRRNSDDKFLLCEVTVISLPNPVSRHLNLARGKPTFASSSGSSSTPSRVVDGDPSGWWDALSCWRALDTDVDPYWMVDLQETYQVSYVTISSRLDCCADSLHDVQVLLYEDNPLDEPSAPSILCDLFPGPASAGVTDIITCIGTGSNGRYVKINGLKRANDGFHLCEVAVFSYTHMTSQCLPQTYICQGSKRVGGSVESLPDTSRSTCIASCSIRQACLGFNHNEASSSCELIKIPNFELNSVGWSFCGLTLA